MARRSEFIQIRITPREKARLKQLARSAGQDLSSYVLGRSLPPSSARFEEILGQLAGETEPGYVLAELNDFLSGLAPVELSEAVRDADVGALDDFRANYVAAMVEHAAQLKGQPSPGWTRRIEPLERPHFASRLRSHRLHLLRVSPVAFRKRNLFVDASVGSRV